MVVVGSESQYGDRRTFIKGYGKRIACGKVGKVSYPTIIKLLMKFVRYERQCRLRDVVTSLERYMNVELDMARIKQSLGDKVVERKEVDCNGVMKVEDWIVLV